MSRVTIGKHLIFFLLVITAETVKLNSKDCNYIKNVQVYVNFALFSPFVQNGNTYEKTVHGCLEDAKFLGKLTQRIGINCTGSEITMLEENSIRNMAELKSIDIISCPVEKMEPNAFTNVPKLESITLMFGTIKEIQKGIFDVMPTLTKVNLRGHEIDYVEDYSFGSLPKLQVIELSYNRLRYISTNWFTNSTRMLQLYLNYNFISRIRQGTFQFVPNLQYFFVSHNIISTIDAGAFDGLSELLYMDLGHNHLTTISQDIFPKALSMGYLNLERNLLNYLSVGFLERILRDRTGGSLKIVGNPLKCPCLDTIHRWMYEENFDSRLVIWKYNDVKNCFNSSSILPVCGVAGNVSTYCTSSVDIEMTERYVKALEKHLPLDCI